MPKSGQVEWDPKDFQSRAQHAWEGLSKNLRGGRMFLIVIIGLVVLRLLAGAVVIVPAGKRAVVFSKFSGVLETQLNEGLHLLIPWAWSATQYNVRDQTWTVTVGEHEAGQSHASEGQLDALTLDGQQVFLDISVVYHADPSRVWWLHQNGGPRYRDKVIRPQTRCVCRTVISQFSVTDLYAGDRDKIRTDIHEALESSLMEWGIILDQLLLRNVSFSEEFRQSIEAKQVAIQEFERMQYELQAAEKTQEQAIIEAEAEAESLKLQGKALRDNPLVLNYEYSQRIAPSVQGIVTERATTPPSAPNTGGR